MTPPVARLRGRSRDLVVHRCSYVHSLRKADRHVRYICFRARELPTDRPGIFSKDRDTADVGKFIRSLDDPVSRGSRRGRPVAKLHKMVFSMRQRDWERAGLTSWRPIIRQAMAEAERHLGRRLEWVAAEHMSRSHPHCHVAIKSVTYDSQGRGYRLYLDRAALQVFKGEVTRLVMRELHRVREEERQVRRHLDRPGPRQLFRTVADFLTSLQRHRQMAEMERLKEIKRQADLERGGRDR